MSLEDQLGRLRGSPEIDVEPAVALATGLAEGFRMYESAVGTVAVTFNPEGVSNVAIPDELASRLPDRRLIEALPPAGWDRRIGRALERGTPGDLPLDLRGVGPFHRTVLRIAATIPRGELRPYGWLAREAGSPNAGRAVGSAMARNPIPLIVPCHRVVRSDGHIGNYSLGGVHNKVVLLEHEGHDVEAIERSAGRGVRYVGSDTTGVFCLPTCRNARRITSSHRIELRSVAEAAERGFRACQVCRP